MAISFRKISLELWVPCFTRAFLRSSSSRCSAQPDTGYQPCATRKKVLLYPNDAVFEIRWWVTYLVTNACQTFLAAFKCSPPPPSLSFIVYKEFDSRSSSYGNKKKKTKTIQRLCVHVNAILFGDTRTYFSIFWSSNNNIFLRKINRKETESEQRAKAERYGYSVLEKWDFRNNSVDPRGWGPRSPFKRNKTNECSWEVHGG